MCFWCHDFEIVDIIHISTANERVYVIELKFTPISDLLMGRLKRGPAVRDSCLV